MQSSSNNLNLQKILESLDQNNVASIVQLSSLLKKKTVLFECKSNNQCFVLGMHRSGTSALAGIYLYSFYYFYLILYRDIKFNGFLYWF